MTALQNICELRIKTLGKFMQYALYTNKIHHNLLECNNYSCSPYSFFFLEENERKYFFIARCWDEGKWDVIFLRCVVQQERVA